MVPLDPTRKKLLDIVRTPYTDALSKISDILNFVAAADADRRAGLIGDVVCWWNMVPMDPAHANTIRLPFTRHSRVQAALALEALIERHELAPDDPFEQNLPPVAVGALVMEQLAKAQAHSQLIMLEFFFRILSNEYVPYVRHVVVVDTDPVTPEEMYATALDHTEELSMLEAMYQSPQPFSVLSAWAVGLASRTDERTARCLIFYAVARQMVLTRTATQQMMTDDLPRILRLGMPPGDDPPDDGNGGSDSKKAN